MFLYDWRGEAQATTWGMCGWCHHDDELINRAPEDALPSSIQLMCKRCLHQQEMRIEDLDDVERFDALAIFWEAFLIDRPFLHPSDG